MQLQCGHGTNAVENPIGSKEETPPAAPSSRRAASPFQVLQEVKEGMKDEG